MSSRGFYLQCPAVETEKAAVGGKTPATRRPPISPEYVASAKAKGQGDICPGCGEFVRLGRGRLFIEHRYRTGSNTYADCQGSGRYSPLPWPPTFKGLETPSFLREDSVRGTFPAEGAK